MQPHGESVLDASLAFLDEIDELPELPDLANHSEAALIDPTELMLSELLELTNADEGDACLPDLPATAIAMPVKEETREPTKTRKKGSRSIGMGTKEARKQEIEFLRTQVQELEGELSRLQKGLVLSAEPTLWEGIAKRQRDVRKQHEIENTELRVLYQGQLKVARGLVRLLHRGQSDMSSAWGNVKRSRIIEEDENLETIFQTIRNSLAARSIPVDEWMEESGLARIYDTFDDARVRCGPENDIFLEILLCRRFPFPFEATVEAVWSHLCTDTIELETAVYGAVEQSDTHLLARSKMGMKMKRLDSALEFYMVGQRVDEHNRVVLTTGFRSTTNGKAFQGKRECLEEYGFMVIERDASCPLGSTVIRSSKRSWPQLDASDGANVSRSQFELLAAMIIDICNGNCRAMLQHAENSLLDVCLRSQRSW